MYSLFGWKNKDLRSSDRRQGTRRPCLEELEGRDVPSSGRFDYPLGSTSYEVASGPYSPAFSRITSATIPASSDDPTLVTIDAGPFAIDNSLLNETTGQWLFGSPDNELVANRDEPAPAPFTITQTTTLALYNGFFSPASLHLSWRSIRPDIAMQSAQLVSGNTVQFTYQTTGTPGPFDVGLYRSTDGITYNPADLIATKSITPNPAGGSGSDSFALSSPISGTPDYPYLLVVADPSNAIAESDEDNNSASILLPKPDIAISAAHLQTSTTVQFTYQTTGNPGPFAVGVYRSTDGITYNPADLIDTTLITTPSAPGGSPGSITLPTEIPIDPARPYILVVADPANGVDETNEDNNGSWFRKLALGVVTHGYELDGNAPSWMPQMVSQLQADGYYSTIAFDWAATSNDWQSGRAILAGQNMAASIRATATMMATEPNDVIDLHLIGHSRGAVVISQALLDLQRNPGPLALQLGYYKMTMLDPHPAHNRGSLAQGLRELNNGTGVSTVGWFSFLPTSWVSRGLAVTTLIMQSRMDDPDIAIPSNVDLAEDYWQQTPWYDGSTTVVLSGFNLWGLPPSDIQNLSSGPFYAFFLPPQAGIGHTDVAEWYLNSVL